MHPLSHAETRLLRQIVGWRDFFYVCILEGAPNDIPLSRRNRLAELSLFLAEELEDIRRSLVICLNTVNLRKMQAALSLKMPSPPQVEIAALVNLYHSGQIDEGRSRPQA